MIGRCQNPEDKDFLRYGGRGICVCDDWKKFRVFYAWAVENGYRVSLQVDRRDNNQGYSPSNCRFVTPRQQQRNRSDNVLINAFGETKTAKDWSEDPRCVVAYPTLIARVSRQKAPAEAAIITPSRPFGQRHVKII
jgi:hypothetical protein